MQSAPDEQTRQLPTSAAAPTPAAAPTQAPTRLAAPRPGPGTPWLRTWLWPGFWLRVFVHVGTLPLAALGLLVAPPLAVAMVLGPFGVLGAPPLWLTIAAARRFGQLDRARLRRIAGAPIEASPYPGLWRVDRSAIGWLRASDRWREIGYALLRLPAAAGLLVLAAAPWLAIGLVVAAAVRIGDGSGWWFLLAAAVTITLAPLASWSSVRADVWLARKLLGPDERAELNRRVRDLIEARAGAVAAADAERRRIERDLHDGAQQSLVTLALHLGMARARFDADPEQARQLVAQSHEEAKAALVELRELVRGMHPAVLDELGLDAALSALAARCPVPVQVEVEIAERPPRPVESAAYFVAAETLTNIGRHSHARKASLQVTGDGSRLQMLVCDDGVGGADPTGGTGLHGLAGRVRALDGELTVDSPAGGPTIVRVEMPCGS
jgi:signal transduction histidine kinase